MNHAIRCTICLTIARVNGQRGIDKFRNDHHHHLSPSTIKTGQTFKLDNQQDRINLALDKAELITHR